MEGRLPFLLCVLALGRAAVIPRECPKIQALHGRLLYEERVTNMKENFPIDYKLYVKYEEVLRCQNITTLINKGITVKELRYLWGIVNESVLKTIQDVLPQRHPSRQYIADLQKIFGDFLRDSNEQQEESALLEEIQDKLHQSGNKVKGVPPKALLDNCFKVLYALYEEECALCNPRSDVEDTLCPPETVPELSSQQRTPCKS